MRSCSSSHWRLLLLIALSALSQMAGPPDVRAQSDLRVTALVTPEYAFGGSVTFKILAASTADINDVTLFIRTPDEPRTFVGKPRFALGHSVEAVYELERARRRLAAFSPVEYWWELADAAGNVLATEHQSFTYADNRFNWQTLTDGRITVAWYAGDRAFAQAALDVAVEGLAQANRDIQAPLPDRITVYIYARPGDAREALSATDRLWANGHANPLFDVVIVTLPPGEADTATRMTREIPHELTHILVAQKVGERWVNVPAWLNEGLAVVNEGAPSPDTAASLADAREAGSLLSLTVLCGPFPVDPAQAALAYAESESVVRYLLERYGSQQLTDMLLAYAEGLDCDHGVQRTLGVSLAEMEHQWLEARLGGSPGALPWEKIAPWFVVSGLVVLGPLVFILLTRLKPARPMV